MQERDAIISNLQNLSEQVCGGAHHHRWLHDGRDLMPCSSEVRENRLYCNHQFGNIPALHAALNLARDEQRINDEQRTALQQCLTAAGNNLFSNCDSEVITLASIHQMYVDPPQNIDELREHHTDMLRAYGVTETPNALNPEMIVSRSRQKMLTCGAPIKGVKDLLCEVLSMSDISQAQQMTDDFLKNAQQNSSATIDT